MKATKKILGATCALVAAVAVSAGSTFAWFTANQSITVGTIDATVVTLGGDLQVGLVKYQDSGKTTSSYYKTTTNTVESVEKWGYSISDLSSVLNGVYLDAVTSTNGSTFTNKAGTTVSTPNVTNESGSTKNGSYVEFTLAFRSTTNMDLYIVNGSSVTTEKNSEITTDSNSSTTTIAAWKTITQNEYGANNAYAIGESISANAIHAARVSFTDSSSTLIWAPYEDTQSYVQAGTTDSSGTYSRGGIANLTTAGGFYLGNLSNDYYVNNNGSTGSYTQVVYSKDILVAPVTKTVIDDAHDSTKTSTNSDDVTKAAKAKVLSLDAGEIKYMTIRLWIEGTDGDCFNSVFGQDVKLDLAFYGVDVVRTSTEASSQTQQG
jgi:hypothetical protein